MSIRQKIVESPPGIKWHAWRIVNRVLYRSAFAAFGEGTVIVAPRTLRGVDRISIGKMGAIFSGGWLQCEPGGSITIGDRAYFGDDVHIHSGGPITIGSGCLIGAGSLIISAEHTRGDRHGVIASAPIVIGDNVFIGDRCTILGGVTIGDGATIGASAVVTHDVPADALVVGNPARIADPTDR